MPEIVDNKKVGEYIKQLLKEHEMTQNDLANELHITRSAVSQNLNGKSTFDLQNLIRISEIFNVSLDTLLDMKSSREDDVISEYERLVKKGLEELKRTPLEELILHTKDLYGKVFIEYVIEYNNKELFTYLITNKVPLYDTNSSNIEQVLLKMIIFMIKNQMNGFISFIGIYIELFGSLTINDETLEKQVLEGLENYTDKEIIKELFTKEFAVKEKIAKLITKSKKVNARSTIEWMKSISKYHLNNLLKTTLETKDVSINFDKIIYYMILSGYKTGVKDTFDSLNEEQLLQITSRKKICRNVILYLKDLSSIELLDTALSLNIYDDLTLLLTTLVKDKNETLYTHIIGKYPTMIDYKKLGLALVELDNSIIFKTIIEHLSQDDKDFLLSKTTSKQSTINMLLLNNKANFKTDYFNRETSEKINTILDEVLNREEQWWTYY